jgi:hypothetical protein
MNELLVGYARLLTEQQDLTAQRTGLNALGVGEDRICVDHDRREPRPTRASVGPSPPAEPARLPFADDRERDSGSASIGELGDGNHLPRVMRIAQAILWKEPLRAMQRD